MFYLQKQFFRKSVGSLALLLLLSACGSGSSTDEKLQSVTSALDGSYQLDGTSCGDGSSFVSMKMLERTALSKLEQEMTHFCSTSLDPQREEASRLKMQKADLFSEVAAAQSKVSNLEAQITNLDQEIEQASQSSDVGVSMNGQSRILQRTRLSKDIKQASIELEQREKEYLELSAQTESAEQALLNSEEVFKNDFQCDKQENIRGAGDILKLLRDSLYADFAVPQILASQLVTSEEESKKDFIPVSLWKVVLPQLELVRRSIARSAPSLISFYSETHQVSDHVSPINTSEDPEEKKYLDSGEKSDQKLVSVSERDSLNIRFEIDEGVLWTVYENKANECIQKFPAEMEMLSDNQIEVFPSLDLLATCSDSCGRLEKELCNRFSANVKSKYSEKQRRSLNLEEARSVLYPDSSVRFEYSKSDGGLLLTRVGRDSGEPMAVKSTKKLRLEVDPSSVCSDPADTSFVFRKLQDTSAK